MTQQTDRAAQTRLLHWLALNGQRRIDGGLIEWAEQAIEDGDLDLPGEWTCRGCGDHYTAADAEDGDVEPWCAGCRTAGRGEVTG
jgi:hypothetical protein